MRTEAVRKSGENRGGEAAAPAQIWAWKRVADGQILRDQMADSLEGLCDLALWEPGSMEVALAGRNGLAPVRVVRRGAEFFEETGEARPVFAPKGWEAEYAAGLAAGKRCENCHGGELRVSSTRENIRWMECKSCGRRCKQPRNKFA